MWFFTIFFPSMSSASAAVSPLSHLDKMASRKSLFQPGFPGNSYVYVPEIRACFLPMPCPGSLN